MKAYSQIFASMSLVIMLLISGSSMELRVIFSSLMLIRPIIFLRSTMPCFEASKSDKYIAFIKNTSAMAKVGTQISFNNCNKSMSRLR